MVSRLTLSVGGVDFCLVPSNVESSVQFTQNSDKTSVTLDLASFTGQVVVKVSSSASSSQQPNHERGTPTDNKAAKVTPKFHNHSTFNHKKRQLGSVDSPIFGNDFNHNVADANDDDHKSTSSFHENGPSEATTTPVRAKKFKPSDYEEEEKEANRHTSLAVDEDEDDNYDDKHADVPSSPGLQDSQTQATLLAQMDLSQTQMSQTQSGSNEDHHDLIMADDAGDTTAKLKLLSSSTSSFEEKLRTTGGDCTPGTSTTSNVQRIMQAATSRPSSPAPDVPKPVAQEPAAVMMHGTPPSSKPSIDTDGDNSETIQNIPRRSPTEKPPQASRPAGNKPRKRSKSTNSPKLSSSSKNESHELVQVAATTSENTLVETPERKACSPRASISPDKEAPRLTQPPPSARWGHTVTGIGNNRFLVYGGQGFNAKTNLPCTLNDLYVYDMAKKTWYKPFSGDGFPRQWHTATYLPKRQLLLAFGGESMHPKSGKVRTHSNITVLDTELMVWYPPTVSGDVPSGRSGHAAAMLDQDLIVFGGVKGSKWLNTVSVLNTQSWVWRTPKIQGSAPKPRSYHSATTVGNNRIVIFGGNDAEESFTTVHVLEKKQGEGGDFTWQWSHPMVTGYGPSARTGHSATLLADGRTICIYGGWDPNDDDARDDEALIFNDAFLLNTENWQWQKLQQPLPKRVGHEAILFENQLMTFGGRIPKDLFTDELQIVELP